MTNATAHNGGTLQTNPWFLQAGGDYAFINFVKMMQPWDWANNSNQVHPDLMDGNGYPSAASGHALWTTGGVYNICYIPTQANRPGKYVVKWTGDGLAAIDGTKQSGETITSAGGRRVYAITSENPSFGSNRIGIYITSRGASDYIRDLVVCHEDDEALYDAGERFSPLFKQRLIEGGFGVIRFLDWQGTNTSTLSQVSQMLPESYYSYNAPFAQSSLYVSSTTNTGDAFSCSAPSGWGGLVDRASITVTFSASSSNVAPTLNVGSSGAKTIKDERGGALSVGGNSLIVSGRTATLVYDALLDCWLKVGGDILPNQVGLSASVPLSVMVRLCNEVGAHPWFNVPHYALDPFTSFTADIATYCKNNLSSFLVPRFEASNETWNGIFAVNAYGPAREVARGQSADIHQWHGRALAKMGKAISDVYADDRTKYQVVCGVWTVFGVAPSGHDPRLTSSRYVTESGVAGNAAKFWTTHVACAGYWNSAYDATAEQAMADEYVSATTARKAELLADYVNTNTFQTGINVFSLYTAWKAWGAGFGVNGLCQYEGGWSPDVSVGNANRDAFRLASKTSPDLIRQTHRNYQTFAAAGGIFPSVYLFSGAENAWSVLDPTIYATSAPQWTAFTLWKAGIRRFKVS